MVLNLLRTFTHPLFFFPLCFVCFFTYRSSFVIHGSSLYGVWQSGRKETVLDLAKFVDRGVSVKLSGGRQGGKKTPPPPSLCTQFHWRDREVMVLRKLIPTFFAFYHLWIFCEALACGVSVYCLMLGQ
jgi:hypothetical protein